MDQGNETKSLEIKQVNLSHACSISASMAMSRVWESLHGTARQCGFGGLSVSHKNCTDGVQSDTETEILKTLTDGACNDSEADIYKRCTGGKWF